MIRGVAVVLSAVVAASLWAQQKPPEGPLMARAKEAHRLAEGAESEREEIEARRRLHALRHGDGGVIDPKRMRALMREFVARQQSSPRIRTNSIGGTTWVNLGPTNFAGRVRPIAPHPTVAGTLYVGAVSGGVWKTTDSGASWTALSESLSSLTVGALAIAPSSPDTIYLGTGEPAGSASGIPGIGFLASTDGGANWTFPGAGVLANAFWKLVVHPTNASDVIAGTSGGGFRSTNGGSNWTPFVVPAGTPTHITDVVRDPSNANTLYAAAYGSPAMKILKSVDGGSNWSDFSTGLPALNARIRLAIDGTGTVLYAAFDSSGAAQVYKSVGGGAWSSPGTVSPSGIYGYQSAYNNAMVVGAGGSSTVLVCGVFCARTTNSGVNWGGISGSHHVDVHDLVYDAGGTLYMSTDGGIYSTVNMGDAFTARNTGLVTGQFYKIAHDLANRTRVFGGLQDNGTWRRDGAVTTWNSLVSSDGFQGAVHARNSSVVWASNQPYYGGNHIWRTREPGDNVGIPPLFIQLAPPVPSDEWMPFQTLLAPHPANNSTIYYGTTRLWKSTTGGDAFHPLPTTTTGGSVWNTSTIDAIALAAGNSDVIMVAKGTSIYRSTDGGQTWMLRNTGRPSLYVNHIEIDPQNDSTVYAALASTTGNSLYRSTDGGANWTLRATGLPSFAAQVVRVDPTDGTTLYCGTDVGVYRSVDSGANWSRFGTGMPAVSVYDLQISPDGTLFRAGTHGRGVWELQIPASPNVLPTASIGGPATQTVTAGTALAFSGTTADADGVNTTATWHFPDTWETKTAIQGATSVSHTFTTPGVWPVTLTATDQDDAYATATVVVTVTQDGTNCSSPVTFPTATLPATIVLNTEPLEEGSVAEDPSPSCLGRDAFSNVWISFTAPAAGTYEFSTCGSAFDTVVAAYSGACGTLVELAGACNDNIDPFGTTGCPNGGSTITRSMSNGETIRILIGGKYYYTSRGPLNLTVKLSSATTAPTVTRIAQNAGPSTGGTAVTLYGSNFVSGASLSLGGTAAASVVVHTPKVLTAVTPAHSAGVVDVVVTNPDAQAGRIVGGYTYLACSFGLSPAATTISAAAQGSSFTVTGTTGCGWTARSDATWLSTTSTGIGDGSVVFAVAANASATPRMGTIDVAGSTFTVTQEGIGAPSNLVAEATAATSVSLAWVSAAATVEIWRKSGPGDYAFLTTHAGTSYTDNSVVANTGYAYKVRGVITGGFTDYSAPDVATTVMFTDDPLTPGTPAKAVHILNLRTAVNALRVTAGTGATTFSDGSLGGVTIQAIHVTQLYAALGEARAALLVSPLAGTGPSVGETVKGGYITALRLGVK